MAWVLSSPGNRQCLFSRVQLTKGFSPQDLDRACHADAYDFIFIDGGHTNDQLVADFKESSIVDHNLASSTVTT